MYSLTKTFSLLVALGFVCLFGTGPGMAQKKASEYKPVDGMAGKDVTWVGTDVVAVNQMLDLAAVTDKDYVIDLGSGDGRMVITAAKRGATGLGIEYNPKLVELSQRLAEREGVAKTATFVKADIFKTDFSKATVLMMYLLPELNRKLRPKILTMKPGTRVTSIAFDMGTWKPDKTQRVKACDMADGCTAYLWVVPARAAGRWKLGDGLLTIKQRFQNFSGSYLLKGKRFAVSDGTLDGANISFGFDGKTYQGRIERNMMIGTFKPTKGADGQALPWRAEKSVVNGKSG